jgi:hypothetical protein
MGKPLSWKWKITIGLVLFVLFGTGFIFTPAGHSWMKSRVMDAYNEMPEGERRNSNLGDRYLWVADFRGTICLDSETAIEMYKEFCGYKFPRAGNGEEYMMRALQTGKLDGLCSPDGKTGFGPLHPRAPEAFYEYILLYNPTHSSQFTKAEISNYYRLFFTWCRQRGPEHKVHPMFMKYWPKLRDLGERSNHPWPPDVNPTAAGAPVYDPKLDPTVKQ